MKSDKLVVLKIGDIVYLNSGGPKMTVRYAENPSAIKVDWFNSNHEIKSGYFETGQLTKVV